VELVEISRRLRNDVNRLAFARPVAYVYNPLDYAWKPHRAYLERYGCGRPQVILLGMNPGPFGMAQTGVPFGDVGMVRDWLGIEAPVGRPAPEHPKRPVTGFRCPRGEVSGQRLWGWARDHFATPQRFFERFFISNYCPLAFIEAGGRNRTPDKLPRAESAALFEACDAALRRTVERLRPKLVVGVGRFAADRAAAALEGSGSKLGVMPHPSPASPAANRGWAEQATRALAELGVEVGRGRP
jgi:single-strand selective monofunctional uracil DNA glycosylase